MHRSLVAIASTVLLAAGAVPGAPASATAPPTSTTLVLSTTTSAYGQSVTATATVSAKPGPPQGDVVFSVDASTVKANLGAGGSATVILPDVLVGQHAVVATFVPQIPAEQEGSTSPAQTWVVSQARTQLQVRVIGKGARIPTSVQVKAAGDFGTRPTGRVRVVIRHLGTGETRRVTQLDASAVALTGLGRLRKGNYRLRVTYVGDSQHLRERRSGTFYVRRR
ncbi:Ig-like domain-containing protein [Nocardioides astragali]|uniref:Ig-like domain-containing protein n=1 Tax=Nocardioides astragali TaxID=1776736 RepID=A0ABW2N418_9ACTN|nr:Ig-like domain-containing protein [Nocardioides astragali]